ncbi:MAG TPA: response regulator [Methanoculleus sp.]|nr:response regulator [Methanoculleus sp.]
MDPVRVLVVDDEPIMATVTTLYLEERGGCVCEVCTSARDALDALESTTFDIIVSDYQMPGMDGIAFLQAVRARPEYIPFILFTGRGREEVVIEAFNSGADFYVQKGVDPESQFAELSHKIRHAVERRRSEDALVASESLKRIILDNVTENVVFQDAACRIIWANKAAHYSAEGLDEDLSGRYCYEVWRQRTTPCEGCPVLKAIETGEPRAALISAPTGGDWIIQATPVRDAQGAIIGAVKTGMEFTAWKAIDSERIQNRELLTLAIEAANLAVWDWNIPMQKMLYNDTHAAMLGHAPTELELHEGTFDHLIHPDDLPSIHHTIKEHFEGKIPFTKAEFRVRRQDGRWKWLYACGRVIERDEDGVPVRMVGAHQDITGRKRPQEEILAARDLAFGLAGASSPGEAFSLCVSFAMEVSGMDCGGLYLYDEESGELTLAHVVGLSDAFVEKERRTIRVSRATRQVLYGGPLYPVPADLDDYHRQLLEEEGVRAAAILPILFEGKPIGCINIASHTQDAIPDECRKTLEAMAVEIGSAIARIRAREALKKSNEARKSANHVLNLLSSVTRHDILNQVGALQAYLILLEEEGLESSSAREIYGRMKGITDTIRRHITFTGDYQHMGERDPEWQHVEWVMKRAADSITLNGIHLDITTGPLEIFADPMLEKAFFNLLENAVSHGQRTSRIEVSFREDDGCRLLIVEDDGVGIPGGMKQHIFEKGVGANTGYGLFLVREILEITGMGIREAGGEGAGARFEISIPAGRWRTRAAPR